MGDDDLDMVGDDSEKKMDYTGDVNPPADLRVVYASDSWFEHY